MKEVLSTFGNITTQDLSPQGGSPTALSFVQLPPAEPAGEGSWIPFDEAVTHVAVGVSGTYTGALTASATADGTEWFQLNGSYPFVNKQTGIAYQTIPSGMKGLFIVNIVGYQGLRIDGEAAMTGSALVSMNLSNSPIAPSGALNTVTNGMQFASLPASAADQVASANPGQLVKVVVLTAGTAATSVYDNAAAGAGTLLGVIPANPTVGAIYAFALSVANGITVKGAANTSGLGVSYN